MQYAARPPVPPSTLTARRPQRTRRARAGASIGPSMAAALGLLIALAQPAVVAAAGSGSASAAKADGASKASGVHLPPRQEPHPSPLANILNTGRIALTVTPYSYHSNRVSQAVRSTEGNFLDLRHTLRSRVTALKLQVGLPVGMFVDVHATIVDASVSHRASHRQTGSTQTSRSSSSGFGDTTIGVGQRTLWGDNGHLLTEWRLGFKWATGANPTAPSVRMRAPLVGGAGGGGALVAQPGQPGTGAGRHDIDAAVTFLYFPHGGQVHSKLHSAYVFRFANPEVNASSYALLEEQNNEHLLFHAFGIGSDLFGGVLGLELNAIINYNPTKPLTTHQLSLAPQLTVRPFATVELAVAMRREPLGLPHGRDQGWVFWAPNEAGTSSSPPVAVSCKIAF